MDGIEVVNKLLCQKNGWFCCNLNKLINKTTYLWTSMNWVRNKFTVGTNKIQALIPSSLHCTIANNGKYSKSFSWIFGRSTNGCVLVLNIRWILIVSHSCQHLYANLRKLHLRFHKDLEMVSDKARSSLSPQTMSSGCQNPCYENTWEEWKE